MIKGQLAGFMLVLAAAQSWCTISRVHAGHGFIDGAQTLSLVKSLEKVALDFH